MTLTDKQREAAFPLHIELGDTPAEMTVGRVKGLDKLPASGCALVEFTKTDNGKDGVTLSISTICLQGDGEDEAKKPRDLSEAMGSRPMMDTEEAGETNADDEAEE